MFIIFIHTYTYVLTMEDTDYEQKYLKYKSKYLELKNQVKSQQKNSIQAGGFAYAAGQYVFFIPESKMNVVDDKYYVENKIIKSLDNFTTYLENCTKFMRIGTTMSGSNDAIYTNQSSFSVIGRTANEISQSTQKTWNEAKPHIQNALDKTKQVSATVYDATKQASVNAWNDAKPHLQNAWEKTKQGVSDTVSKLSQPKSTEPTNSLDSSMLGGVSCNNNSIKLSDGLTPFQSLNDVRKETLPNYVRKINETQGNQPIHRIIVVEKKGFLGKVFILNDFVVNYGENNEITVNEKQ